ncbi:MAG: sugar phosphate isomerase/epimerase [Acidobacteria bacterium]|nr:sugar phosphate isomerase/epimerase [Acidobacteriota bacterium]MBI3426920.1 sugar phosphate isomerase/epimerase [Acidobacteriota bacterium]
MNRRDFIQSTVLTTTLAALHTTPAVAAKVNWPIGCFNRPWTKWSFDETLKQTKAAGYQTTGLLTTTRDEPFIGAAATPEYLTKLKARLAANSLKANMGALRSRHNIPLQESIKEVRQQLDNAKFLGLQFALTFGVDKPEEYEHYYKVMSEAAAYAQDKKIKLVMKPHGGGSGASEEILRCINAVKQPNFKIWYDAGNIIYYTGKDPIEELKPIAQHVTGFCAKDCAAVKSDVMIQFGAGKVDFAGVFKTLKAAGYKGPLMVECCKLGATPEETTANARANREFLEKVLAAV